MLLFKQQATLLCMPLDSICREGQTSAFTDRGPLQRVPGRKHFWNQHGTPALPCADCRIGVELTVTYLLLGTADRILPSDVER